MKEECMVFDPVGFAEKFSVVMNSSDSFPFALETLVNIFFESVKTSIRSPASFSSA